MTSGGSEVQRTGSDAVEWFINHRRGGAYVVDAHIASLHAGWGPDVRFTYRAIADPEGTLPTLLIEVNAAPDDEASWERLVATQRDLLDHQRDLAAQMRVRDPFARIAVVLNGEPVSWDSVVRSVRELE